MNNKNNIKSLFNNLEITPSDGVWDNIKNQIQHESKHEMNFQSVFSEFEFQPSKNVWDNIEAALHEQKDRKIAIWWYYGAAAACVLVLFTFMNNFNQSFLNETATTRINVFEQGIASNHPSVSTIEPSSPFLNSTKLFRLNQTTPENNFVTENNSKSLNKVSYNHLNINPNINPKIKSIPIDQHQDFQISRTDYSIELLEEFEELKRDDFKNRKQYRSNSLFQNQLSNLSNNSSTQLAYTNNITPSNSINNNTSSYNNLFNGNNPNVNVINNNSMNSLNSGSSGIGISTTGNIGGQNMSNGIDVNAASNGSLSTSSINKPTILAMPNEASSNQTVTTSVKEVLMETTVYGMPVTLSGNFYLPINNKLGITSGIGYTFIESHTTNYLYDFSTTKKHEFLTIPIELEYSLVSKNKFNFYSCLGSQSNINRTNEIWNINNNLIVGIGSTYRMDKRFGINLSPRIFIPTLNNINYGIKAGLVYFVK